MSDKSEQPTGGGPKQEPKKDAATKNGSNGNDPKRNAKPRQVKSGHRRPDVR